MEGLDGPGLASLAGLKPGDIATAMGLRAEREKLSQQRYRDLINEEYMNAIMGKMAEETRLMEPKLQLQYHKMLLSARGALQKDADYLRMQGWSEDKVNDYMLSKMGDIGEYEKYVKQQLQQGKEPIGFDEYLKQIGKSRATRISIGEKVETAKQTREALSAVDLLGEKGWTAARKSALSQMEDNIDLMLAPPEQAKAIVDAQARKEYETLLKAEFGSENVVAGQRKGVPGWAIRQKDGTIIWRSAP